VAPRSPRPGHGLLRCPICRLDLTAAAGALACRNRHSFDLAREGYVNLLRARRHRPSLGGDRSEQLQHRESFLNAGHFDAVAATIAKRVRRYGAEPVAGCWRVVDAGSGTGYHLSRIAAMLDAPVVGVGLDIAKEAVRRAARHWPDHAFAVADLWAEWPIKDAAADLVISIFAPKNFPEMARVLAPGGWFVVVYPGPNHLVELSHRFAVMRQHQGKGRRYADAARRHIGPPAISRLMRHTVLERQGIRDALLMGPNARHLGRSTLETATGPLPVTFDLFVLLARKRIITRAIQSCVALNPLRDSRLTD
jgi:SAM-dependent methyltransferase